MARTTKIKRRIETTVPGTGEIQTRHQKIHTTKPRVINGFAIMRVVTALVLLVMLRAFVTNIITFVDDQPTLKSQFSLYDSEGDLQHISPDVYAEAGLPLMNSIETTFDIIETWANRVNSLVGVFSQENLQACGVQFEGEDLPQFIVNDCTNWILMISERTSELSYVGNFDFSAELNTILGTTHDYKVLTYEPTTSTMRAYRRTFFFFTVTTVLTESETNQLLGEMYP